MLKRLPLIAPIASCLTLCVEAVCYAVLIPKGSVWNSGEPSTFPVDTRLQVQKNTQKRGNPYRIVYIDISSNWSNQGIRSDETYSIMTLTPGSAATPPPTL